MNNRNYHQPKDWFGPKFQPSPEIDDQFQKDLAAIREAELKAYRDMQKIFIK